MVSILHLRKDSRMKKILSISFIAITEVRSSWMSSLQVMIRINSSEIFSLSKHR